MSSLLDDAVPLPSFYHPQNPSLILARKGINLEMDGAKLLAFALAETQQVSQFVICEELLVGRFSETVFRSTA